MLKGQWRLPPSDVETVNPRFLSQRGLVKNGGRHGQSGGWLLDLDVGSGYETGSVHQRHGHEGCGGLRLMTLTTRFGACRFIAVMLALLVFSSRNQAQNTTRLDEVSASKIDALFAKHAGTDRPGYAVGVIEHGGLAYAKGFGSANLDHRIPISPGSVFNVASLSKQFTAACVGLLITRGRLSLESEVREFIPEFPKRFGAYSEFARREIFEPLGMSRTHVNDDLGRVVPGRVTGYNELEGGGYRQELRRSPHYGGSGVLTTLEDLARWDRNLRDHTLAGKPLTELLLQTRRFRHDKTDDAFGLVWGQYRGERTLWYEGGDAGFSSYSVKLPKQDLSVIVLSNLGSGRAAEYGRAVLDILFRKD